MPEAKRPYRMRARAEAAATTRRRIIEATIALLRERFLDEVTLEAVAQRAGVTVRTVIRRFGSRGGLLAAAAAESLRAIETQRAEAPVGDLEGAVRNVVDHYEVWGDSVLRSLAQEERVPAIRVMTDYGRAQHREWVERVFGSVLDQRRGQARERLLAQLMAVCDVSTWKLLRRDRGLSRRQTELAMSELVAALVGEAPPPEGDASQPG